MCGIGGFLQAGPLSPERARADLASMAAALAHRGPDDEGCWLSPSDGIAFCHRRLSIVDLSPTGAQPMRSPSGRFTITLNGEIYNYRQLRAELTAKGFSFRGGSDTEVLLAAVEQWGVRGALERSRGMFAFGLWDGTERVLWLARDRFGEKPLYYGEFRRPFENPSSRVLVFGSELKALRRHGAWNAEVDRNALALLLRHDFIPAPHTIFRHVRKVRPGCLVRVRADRSALRVEELEYWKPRAPRAPQDAEQDTGQLLETVRSALEESIGLQMLADVPVGAFLSGGIDSSLIVALMQRASSQPVRTFSIGFEEEQFNEAPYARRVAEHLGTQHTELTVTSRDALNVIPTLPRIYDEPFADSSQIPTVLVCRLARQEVTVALSGDAGDELFGGYTRYLEVRDRWRQLQRTPASLRRLAARTLELTPSWALGPVTVLAHLKGRRQVPDRVKERARAWGARSLPELYEAMVSFWQHPARFVLGATDSGGHKPDSHSTDDRVDPVIHMMHADSLQYLPDDILVKVDRAAMAVSLETRVPFLDPQVAEAAWRIPGSIHLKDGRGKWLLRQILERHIPRELIDRPKSGFGVPVARWLRAELKDWAADLLDPVAMRREGYFVTAQIERRWHQHLAGRMNWSSHLWGVLMFQAWLEDFARTTELKPESGPAALVPPHAPLPAASIR